MKICFPTKNLSGLDSMVYEHFGTAPGFVIVETDTLEVEEVQNADLHHAHGMCQPLKALGGRQVNAVAVGGIGAGALMKLQAGGVTVFKAIPISVRENLDLLSKNELPQFSARETCGGHAGGCAHL